MHCSGGESPGRTSLWAGTRLEAGRNSVRADEMDKPSAARARWVWPAVALLLVVYVGLAWQAVRAKGATFDEAEQLVTGYNIWLRFLIHEQTFVLMFFVLIVRLIIVIATWALGRLVSAVLPGAAAGG